MAIMAKLLYTNPEMSRNIQRPSPPRVLPSGAAPPPPPRYPVLGTLIGSVGGAIFGNFLDVMSRFSNFRRIPSEYRKHSNAERVPGGPARTFEGHSNLVLGAILWAFVAKS